jgi:hypothetical protein
MGKSSSLKNPIELSAKRFSLEIMGVRVFHPDNREEISQARVNVNTINLIIWVTIGSP